VNVFARLHTLETTPEQATRGDEIAAAEYLPWLRDSSGFRGLMRLVDNENGKTVVITLWADEESLVASTDANDRLRHLIATASGATYRTLETFEVTTFDLPD
jgi:heme-degrading monooxygenase HmoA